MYRATTAAALLAGLALTAGCSSSAPEATGTTPAATPSAATTSAGTDPTAASSPLDGLSAVDVWKKTKADATAAKTVHVAAKLLDGKEAIGINLKLSDADRAFGTLSFNGDKITVRRLGQTLYFKADRGFWATNADAATAKALADKWIMVKKGFSKDMEQFFQLTDIDFILDDALSLTAVEQKTLKLAPGVDIGTQPTIGLTEGSSTEAAAFQLLYVSAADPALPLNFAMSSDNSQYMKFRGWNEKFTVVAPKDAIDLAKAS